MTARKLQYRNQSPRVDQPGTYVRNATRTAGLQLHQRPDENRERGVNVDFQGVPRSDMLPLKRRLLTEIARVLVLTPKLSES